jgi:hypothetical protein
MTTANLTLADHDTVHQYSATGGTAFTYTFPILATDELKVSVDQVEQMIGADYTVAGVGDAGGGTVTFLAAPANGSLVTLWLDMPIKRLTGFALGASVLLPEALNTEFVRQVRQDQMLRRDLRRSLRLAVDDPQAGQDMVIPTQTTRAGKFLAFNAAGVPIAVDPGSGTGDASLRGELADPDTANLGNNLVAIAREPGEAALTLVAPQRDPGDPRRYGAIGDGVTDDSAAYADAITFGRVLLPEGTDFNIGTDKPSHLASGPGSVTSTGSSAEATVGGFFVGFDPFAGSIIAAPPVWAETANSLSASPGGISSYFNVILAPGSNAANKEVGQNVWRSVIIGEAAGQRLKQLERCEVIGSGAMRFAQLAQRCTAVGTIALSWLGAESQQYLRDTFHDFWLGADKPGDVGWDFGGLETRNPGIGATLHAFANYPTSTSTQSQNVAIGRDSGLHLVRGDDNTMVGYQAGAHFFNSLANTAIGRLALRDGVFVNQSVALGVNAGIHFQEGQGGIFLGHEAGENFVKGDRNIFLGGSSGQDHTHGGGREWSNKFIMEFLSLGNFLTGDMAIANLFIGLDVADISAIEALGSGYYNVVNAGLAPATAGRFLGTATSTVSTFNSFAGSDLARTHATFENTNGVVGSISTTGSATAFNTSSDQRLKVDLGAAEGALERVLAIEVHKARMKGDPEGSERSMLFAQQLLEVEPHVVSGPRSGVQELGDILDCDGMVVAVDLPESALEEENLKSFGVNCSTSGCSWRKTGERDVHLLVDHSALVPELIAAVQELAGRIQ